MDKPPPTFRVYRMRWPWFVTAFLPSALGFGFTFYSAQQQIAAHLRPNPVNWAFAISMLLTGVVCSLYVLTARVEFTQNAVCKQSLFGQKSLQLHAIRGRQEFENAGSEGASHYYRLVPNDPSQPAMDLSRQFKWDQAFFSWFYSLPDLDSKSKKT
ncbi:MAG TPA: hypothetical protein VK716_05150 [Terracidiphilus sp.]|nr:hypothetical protein [Terracidiphilus sp.]